MNWECGELRVITSVGPSGSVELVNPAFATSYPNLFYVGKIFEGDWVMSLGEEWVQNAHTHFVKVLTRQGVGYISGFILKRSSRPVEEAQIASSELRRTPEER